MTSKRIEFVSNADDNNLIRKSPFHIDYTDTKTALAYIHACLNDSEYTNPRDWTDEEYLDEIEKILGDKYCLIILDDLDSITGEVNDTMNAEERLKASLDEQKRLICCMNKLAYDTNSRARIIITSRCTLDSSMELQIQPLSDVESELFADHAYHQEKPDGGEIPAEYVQLVKELSEGVPLFIQRLVYLCVYRFNATIWANEEKHQLKADIARFTLNTLKLTDNGKNLARVLFVLYRIIDPIPLNIIRLVLFDVDLGIIETSITELEINHIAARVNVGGSHCVTVKGAAQLMSSDDTTSLDTKYLNVLDEITTDVAPMMTANYRTNEGNIVYKLLNYADQVMTADIKQLFADRLNELLTGNYVMVGNNALKTDIENKISAMLAVAPKAPPLPAAASPAIMDPKKLIRSISGTRDELLEYAANSDYQGWELNMPERKAMVSAMQASIDNGEQKQTAFNALLRLVLTEILYVIPLATKEFEQNNNFDAIDQLMADTVALLQGISTFINLQPMGYDADLDKLFEDAIQRYPI